MIIIIKQNNVDTMITTFIFMQIKKTIGPGWKGKSQVKLLTLLVDKNVI